MLEFFYTQLGVLVSISLSHRTSGPATGPLPKRICLPALPPTLTVVFFLPMSFPTNNHEGEPVASQGQEKELVSMYVDALRGVFKH